MVRLAGWLAITICAACAAPQEQVRSAAPPGATPPSGESSEDDEPVCHEESVTGSNLPRTVCRSRSDAEREREDARSFSAKTGRMRQTSKGN